MTEEVKNKYAVDCKGLSIDVYDVLNAFGVTCPAARHAIKKLLMPGKRGHKTELGDLLEARASIDRAIDLARERKHIDFARESKAFDEAKAKQLDAIFSQGTALTMGVCDDAPVNYALTDRELRDEIIRNTVDDGQGELPNASPKASLCRECGGTTIDGVCQEKGCGFEALVPSGADAKTLVSIISCERAKDPTKWGSQEIATLIAKLAQQEERQQ